MTFQNFKSRDLSRLPAAWRAGLLAAFMLCVAFTPAAQAGEYAEVGIVKGDGSIKLYEERFKPRFADGVEVAETSVRMEDGVWHVVRKGHADSSCQEAALPLFLGSVMITEYIELEPGDLLSVRASSILTLFNCEDDGCSDYVTPFGNPPQAAYARCETPDSWGAACSCRFPEFAGGELVPVIGACDRRFRRLVISSLNYWIQPAFRFYDSL